MTKSKIKTEKRIRRHKRIRAKVKGTTERPRLAIFRSNKAIYAQIIDDLKGETLVSITSFSVKGKNPLEGAKEAGKEIAKLAKDKNIKAVVSDRGGYIYTGKVRAVAEGAREGGLEF